jgi:hypothetical protein
MTLFPAFGVPSPAAPLEILSRDCFDLDFANAEWTADSSSLIAASGHVGTFSRGATLASIADMRGATYTAVNAQMGWEARDWDNDSVREAFGWRTGSSDRLAFPCLFRSNLAMSWMIEFIETGAVIGTAAATLWGMTADDGTGDGWFVDTSGTASGFYRYNYRVGGTTRQATLAARPVSGDRVRLMGDLTQSGVATIYQSINGAAATSASAAALAQPSSWSSNLSVRFNSRGTSANPLAGAWYRRARIVFGALDQSIIAERR